MHETRSVRDRPHLTWDRFEKFQRKRATSDRWLLDIVTTESGFDALEDEWTELVTGCSAGIFQTFEWARTWWKHFGNARQAELNILILKRNGDTVAIAPLFREVISIVGLVKAVRLCFIGRKDSDYLDIITRNDVQEEVYIVLADYFSKNKDSWDLIFLEDVPDRSPTHVLLPRVLVQKGMIVDTDVTDGM